MKVADKQKLVTIRVTLELKTVLKGVANDENITMETLSDEVIKLGLKKR